MGARSRIAVANADGSFTSIYCHWDGYPSHHGVILRDHYSDPAKVAHLIALGSLSTLGPEIGKKHNFDKAPEGVCNAYGRDRGEKDVNPERSENFEALCALTQETGGEFLYVFKGGNWFVAEGGVAYFGNPADKAPEFLEHVNEVLIRAKA